MGKSLRSSAHRLLIAKLKAARLRAGLSQQALADHLGHSQSYIAKIETGERRIDVIEFLEMLDVLNCSYYDILQQVDLLVRQSKSQR